MVRAPTNFTSSAARGEQRLDPEVRRRRDALELNLAQLRESKRALSAEEYQEKLRRLLLELAALLRGTLSGPLSLLWVSA
jgi:hypothetical protein